MNRGIRGIVPGIGLLLWGCSTSIAPPTEADVVVAQQRTLAAQQSGLLTAPIRAPLKGLRAASDALTPDWIVPAMRWEECRSDDTDCQRRYARQAQREKHCKELMLRHGIDLTGLSVFATRKDPQRAADLALLSVCVADPMGLPVSNFGISLSGGGPRSASFSMGVLKALHDLDYLERVETISSVSGGGYTSFWYFMQQYHTLLHVDQEKPWRDYGGILAGLQALARAEHEAGLGNAAADFPHLAERLAEQGVELDPKVWQAARFCARVQDEQRAERSLVARMFEARTDHAIVDNDYRYQRHLAEQSDIINYSQYALVQSLETSGLMVAHGLTLPVYWITDGVLNTNLLDGWPLRDAYQKGLERTYGLTLNDRYQDYIDYLDRKPDQYLNGRNGRWLWWRSNARIRPVTFTQMRQFLRAYNLCAARAEGLQPMAMPIINTKETLPPGFRRKTLDDDHAELGLAQGVFSFSPVSWGSMALRFQDDGMRPAPVDMPKAVAISGAAADRGARELNGPMGKLLTLANANLGYDIRRPDQSRAEPVLRGLDVVLGGFPLKYVMPDGFSTTIRLSDGGHAENLGVYPLLERGTRYMVVVDAEHDGDYVFDALNRVMAKLRAQADAARQVSCTLCPNAGDLLEGVSPAVFDLHLTNISDEHPVDVAYVKLSLPRRYMLDGDAPARCTPSLARLREQALARRRALDEGAQDEAAMPPLPCSVWHYYLREQGRPRNAFPHNSTADIWYDSLQYEAYRDLGYYLGLTELADLLANWRDDIVRLQAEERALVRRYRQLAGHD